MVDFINYQTFKNNWNELIDDEYVEEFEKWKIGSEITRWLQSERIKAGITEEEIADKLGWEIENVFEFEMAEMGDIHFGNLLVYINTLGMSVKLNFNKLNAPVQDKIAGHVFEIRELLKGLIEDAGDDPNITINVVKFIFEYNQLMANLVAGLLQSMKNKDALEKALHDVMDISKNKSKTKLGYIPDFDYENGGILVQEYNQSRSNP